MTQRTVLLPLLLALLCNIWAKAIQDPATEVPSCISESAAVKESCLLQTSQVKKHGLFETPSTSGAQVKKLDLSESPSTSGVNVELGDFGPATIPEALLNKMVLPNPFKCEFVGDERTKTCEKTMGEAGLNPLHLTKARNEAPEAPNALRTFMPIGSFPCCTTAPYCASPACLDSFLQEDTKVKTCTKRPPGSDFAYMAHPDVFPAYYGFGGAFELDVQKHWDMLARVTSAHPDLPPFDLAIDLGANSGLVTEKLVMRRFAKDYIMVEANSDFKPVFDARFGDVDWRHRFVTKQSATWEGAKPFDPGFEFLHFALSDQSGGVLETSSYQEKNLDAWGVDTSEKNIWTAEMATVDSILPGNLSADFAAKFAKARSAYVKVDTEGMDQKVLHGMRNLLAEKRGDDFLVNFLMFEYCPSCMDQVRETNHLDAYDLKTLSQTIESLGFEAFFMGPRYLPLTHGSWDDSFLQLTGGSDQRCNVTGYPKFMQFYPHLFSNGQCKEDRSELCGDIFALRHSHPKATEIKVALGACKESNDFDSKDPQYDWQAKM